MRGGIDILRGDVPRRKRETQGMVDGPLSALGGRQPFVGSSQTGQDRQSGRVRGRIAECAEFVRTHVPDRFLRRVPQTVGMRQLHAAGIRKQGWIRRPRHPIQLVGGVGIFVPDEQVRIASLATIVAASVRIRSVLVIPLDDGACRNRHRHDIAFPRIVVDDDVDLGGRVAVNNVVRDAVERTLAVGGTVLAPVWMNGDRTADVRDDGRRVGRHRGVGDVLIPGIVRGKELLTEHRQHHSIFQLLNCQSLKLVRLPIAIGSRVGSAIGRDALASRIHQQWYSKHRALLFFRIDSSWMDCAKSVPLFTQQRDASRYASLPKRRMRRSLPRGSRLTGNGRSCPRGGRFLERSGSNDERSEIDVRFLSFYTFTAHRYLIF